MRSNRAEPVAAAERGHHIGFVLDIGMIPLTGTTDAEHMQADLEVFDFRLEPDEVERIEGLTVA